MSDAIKVLKKFVKDCNECCADDISYRQPVEDAINEAIIALEQKEKYDNMGFCCDSCGSETASCLTLCPDCNERKQGALEKVEEFDDVLEEMHMDIYGHDWSKKEILEYIVRIKNKYEKELER